jgi:hypothetical protein
LSRLKNSLEELIVACAFYAPFSHFWVAVDVSVWKSAAFDKENLNSQQNYSKKNQNQGQKEYLHAFYFKNACKFKKGF